MTTEHNEQPLISSLKAAATGNTTTIKMMELCGAAAKALSSNQTNQPAAAQEAVGVVVENVNGEVVSYSGVLFAKFILSDNFAPGMKLYAAPVTAAPAEPCGYGCPNCGRDYQSGQKAVDALATMIHTPAAPGIDAAVLARDIHHAIADAGLAPLSPADNHTIREVIRSVIDASPKGDEAAPLHAHYCNAQPASAACICGLDSHKGALNEQFGSAEWLDSPKGGSEAPAVENVAEDTYHAIAEVLRTEGGWSVLEHVEYCRELIWEARVALGRDGANADTNHRHRGLWVKLGRCLEGFAPGSDEALSELSKCDCQNPCPETGAALVSMACPIHNDLPAAQASDAEVRP